MAVSGGVAEAVVMAIVRNKKGRQGGGCCRGRGNHNFSKSIMNLSCFPLQQQQQQEQEQEQ